MALYTPGYKEIIKKQNSFHYNSRIYIIKLLREIWAGKFSMDSSNFDLLVENSYEYFMRHGVGPSDLRKVEEIYSNNRICVLGFSGALGERV